MHENHKVMTNGWINKWMNGQAWFYVPPTPLQETKKWEHPLSWLFIEDSNSTSIFNISDL